MKSKWNSGETKCAHSKQNLRIKKVLKYETLPLKSTPTYLRTKERNWFCKKQNKTKSNCNFKVCFWQRRSFNISEIKFEWIYDNRMHFMNQKIDSRLKISNEWIRSLQIESKSNKRIILPLFDLNLTFLTLRFDDYDQKKRHQCLMSFPQ